MAVNIGGAEAEVRVGTLNIRADRVRADVGDDESLNLSRANPGRRLNERQPTRNNVRRRRRETLRSPLSKLQSRCFFGFMIVPFVVILALQTLGITTFAVKNHQAVQNCNLTCSLVCNNQFLLSRNEECTITYVSGGLSGFVALVFIFSLLVRVCSGSKILSCFVMFELFILFIGLASAVLFSLLLNVGSKTKPCLISCGSGVDFEDWSDFMEQAKYTVWIGAGIFVGMAIMWAILTLSTCCMTFNTREQRRIEAVNVAAGERRNEGRRWPERRLSDEQQPLLQN